METIEFISQGLVVRCEFSFTFVHKSLKYDMSYVSSDMDGWRLSIYISNQLEHTVDMGSIIPTVEIARDNLKELVKI